jgi:hypothetical protein
MKRLVVLLVELTALRKGPQDMPTGLAFQQSVLLAYALVNLVLLQMSNAWSTAVMQLLLDCLLMVSFTWPLLYVSGHRARFPQTLIALLGADAVINFFALPALASLNQEPSELGVFAMLLIGHIYRHALERPLLFTLILAFLYLMLSSQIMEAVFPPLNMTPEIIEQASDVTT